LGGEWGGAVLLAAEHAPARRRGLYAALPQVGAAAGSLVANGAVLLSGKLAGEWAWRIPFLFSVVLVGVGTFIRLRVAESPAFEAHGAVRMPLIEVLRAHKRSVGLAMGARLAENVFFYIYTVTVLSYVTVRTGLAKDVVLRAVLVAMAIDLVAIPMFGALSDKLGRRPVYLFGAIFSALFVAPFFLLVDTGRPVLVGLAIVLAVCVGHAAMYGPQASFFAELFGANVRYTGASLGYQLASVLGGGLAPLIATALFAWTHGGWWAVALYMIGCAVVTTVAVLAATETRPDSRRDRP
jgi:MFS family permease